jgi:hypothetical protein
MQGREVGSALRPSAAVRSDEGEAMSVRIDLNIKAVWQKAQGTFPQEVGLSML